MPATVLNALYLAKFSQLLDNTGVIVLIYRWGAWGMMELKQK